MDSDSIAAYKRAQLSELNAISEPGALDEWHRRNLARAGAISQWKRGIGAQPKEKRGDFGKAINEASDEMQAAYDRRRAQFDEARIAEQVLQRGVDITLPNAGHRAGNYHPVTRTLNEICDVFGRMGFSVVETPEVERDEYNFQLLNMPKHHPARDMQDTFYIDDSIVLRTHTSPGQIYAMRSYAPEPCRVVLPGRCYRNEDITPRSEVQFHQIEGLVVGPNVRFSDLRGVLLRFAREMYGAAQKIRMRGSYFPFTEPSVEVDIRCTLCGGEGCRICKFAGWLEILGGGMVHPVVLRNGGYDPSQVRGIAFGMGVERTVLLRHQISDIRKLFQNDLRFLEALD